MSGYRPMDPAAAVHVLALVAVCLLVGFCLSRLRPSPLVRGTSWALAVFWILLAERLSAEEPGGFRMLAIVLSVLIAMKGVVSVEARASTGLLLSGPRWLGFAAAWPGMSPDVFAQPAGNSRRDATQLFRRGAGRFAAGLVLTLGASWVWRQTHSRALATAILLPGLSLVVHFGLFDMLAAAWRRAGIPCGSLFREPLKSTNLSEFWSRRWNLAFTEMVGLVCYRPLARVSTRSTARFAGFLFSGVLHEIAISLPVKAGWGLPFLYFALQGLLVFLEGRLRRSGHPVDRLPLLGRIWTFTWLLLPLPLLFHVPFLRQVVWPLIGIE